MRLYRGVNHTDKNASNRLIILYVMFCSPIITTFLYIIVGLFGQTQFENSIVQSNNNYSTLTKQMKFQPGLSRQNMEYKEKGYSQQYVSITNLSQEIIRPLLVVNGRDWSSNASMLKSALQSKIVETDHQKVMRLAQYVHDNIAFHEAPYASNISKPRAAFLMNVLGYGICSDYSFAFATLLKLAGYNSRVLFLTGIGEYKHVVVEVNFDGSWHMFDPTYAVTIKDSNGEIASVENIFRHPEWIDTNLDLNNNSSVKEFLRNIYKGKIISKIEYTDVFLSPDVHSTFSYPLGSKEEIRLYTSWSSPRIVDDSTRPIEAITQGFLKILTGFTTRSEELVRNIELPYPVTAIFIIRPLLCISAPYIFISIDGGPWVNTKNYCQNDRITISPLLPAGKNLNIFHTYSIKILHPNLHAQFLTIYGQFELSSASIPRLQNGINSIESMYPAEMMVKFVFERSHSSR